MSIQSDKPFKNLWYSLCNTYIRLNKTVILLVILLHFITKLNFKKIKKLSKMILTAAIYTKVFCALSHKIRLVRFWARGWLTVTSSVAPK